MPIEYHDLICPRCGNVVTSLAIQEAPLKISGDKVFTVARDRHICLPCGCWISLAEYVELSEQAALWQFADYED